MVSQLMFFLSEAMKPSPPATPDADSDSSSPEEGGLLFAWTSHKAVVAHLGLFLAVSAGIHFFGFYLFQVVYPVTARVEPVPSRVRLLDSTQPAVISLLRQIDDRLVFLRPASAGSEARVDLADRSVQFRPSFGEGQLEFLRMPLAENPGDDGDGLGPVLPPVERLSMPETTLRQWRIGGELTRREVRRPEALAAALAPFADALSTDEAAIRVNLTVDRQGNVRGATIPDPEVGEDPRFEKLETTVFTHLRFEPETGLPTAATPGEEPLQRGWLEVVP